jgi:uncharacterized membrane protein YuzA (DUF378 family)
MRLRVINTIALIIAIIGALNWLLVGLFSFDLIASLFANGYGTISAASRVIYIIVGAAGLWLIFTVLPSEQFSRQFVEKPTP